MQGARLERLVLRFDKELAKLERDELKRLIDALNRAEKDLKTALRSSYSSVLDEVISEPLSFREARARALLSQLEPLIKLAERTPDGMQALTRAAYELASENALEAITVFDPRSEFIFPALRTDVILQARNARARFLDRGKRFADKVQSVIIGGIVKGQGYRKTARELSKETGTLRSDAERIVRTETVAASDKARKDRYKENGVEGEQLIVTADSRLCGYCAARAGYVYKLGDLVLPLHPHCRCYLAPWRESWVERELSDDDWYRAHRKESLERASEPPRFGAAPLERARGESAPKPIYRP